MCTVAELVSLLDRLAPPDLAEDWDNTGLLWGDPTARVSRVMTCLTLTEDVAGEAVRRGAGLIVTHHPLPFRPVTRVVADDAQGRILWSLARANVAVHSPHTRWDNAPGGVNDRLAERLGLTDVRVLRPDPDLTADGNERGAGRWGGLPEPVPFHEFAAAAKDKFDGGTVQVVPTDRDVRTVAVACGAAAEYLADADRLDCDAFVTGEARFHDALAARTRGVGLILLGHYASERFAQEALAERITAGTGVETFASAVERDPLAFM